MSINGKHDSTSHKTIIFKKLTTGNILSLRFQGEITIYTAAGILNYLAGHGNQDFGLLLDLGNVRKIDTSGFQLLLFIKKIFETRGKKFEIRRAAESVKDLMNLYGEKKIITEDNQYE